MEAKTPIKVSLIIVVFNGAKFLPNLLASLCRIATNEVQVVVVDDGSKDQSFVIASEFKKSFCNYTLKKLDINVGVGNARNVGIELSVGDYIYFLDCDDWISGSLLSDNDFGLGSGSDLILSPIKRQISNLSNESYLSALASTQYRNRQDFLSISLSSGSLPGECWGVFFRRKFLEKYQLRFKPVRIAEDLTFMAEVFVKMSSYAIANSPVYYHSQTFGGLSKSFSTQDIESWFCCVLSISDISRDYLPKSSEGEVIARLFTSCYAYFLLNLILSDVKAQHMFLEKVLSENVILNPGKRAQNDGLAVLKRLAEVENDDACEPQRVLKKISLTAQHAIKDIGGLANSKKIYLYCYDRLSIGVCRLMRVQNILVSGIIDDNADSIVVNESQSIRLLSPSQLSLEMLKGAIVVVCNDKPSVFCAIKKRLMSGEVDDLKVVAFTTADLVKGFPLMNLLGDNQF